jgi:hypothetical protein
MFLDGKMQKLVALHHFLNVNNEGKGWVVKFPFKTNGDGMYKCSKVTDVFKRLQLSSYNYYKILPYAIIQPNLLSSTEYKVVYLKGIAQYHLMKGKNNGFSKKTKTQRPL